MRLLYISLVYVLSFHEFNSSNLPFYFSTFSPPLQPNSTRLGTNKPVSPPVGDARYAAVLQTPPAHVGLMGLLLPWNGNGLTTKMSKCLVVYWFENEWCFEIVWYCVYFSSGFVCDIIVNNGDIMEETF